MAVPRYPGGQAGQAVLGGYPDVSLKEARAERDEIRKEVSKGTSPLVAIHRATGEDTFEALAWDWFKAQVQPIRSQKYAQKIESRLKRQILPYLGARPSSSITPPEVLLAARAAETRGLNETAHRIVWTTGQIFRYGIASGRVASDPTYGLSEALTPARVVHHPSVTKPDEIRALWRAIEGMKATPVVCGALRFSALTFCRPGEVRRAEWAEIDLVRSEWRIPAEKMKLRRVHLVPRGP